MLGIKTKKARLPVIKQVENRAGIKLFEELCPACGYELIWERVEDCFCSHCGQEINRDNPLSTEQKMMLNWRKENGYD